MNAADTPPSPEPRSLSPEMLDRLREAITASRGDPSTPPDILAETLIAAATEASDRNVRPEALIVALKGMMDGLSFGRSLGSEEQRRMREWIVTTCIRAYYERR